MKFIIFQYFWYNLKFYYISLVLSLSVLSVILKHKCKSQSIKLSSSKSRSMQMRVSSNMSRRMHIRMNGGKKKSMSIRMKVAITGTEE